MALAAWVHPAVSVMLKGYRYAYVVDWEVYEAGERIIRLHSQPSFDGLDQELEAIIDESMARIDGFYHAHRSSFAKLSKKNRDRLKVRSETLLDLAAKLKADISYHMFKEADCGVCEIE